MPDAPADQRWLPHFRRCLRFLRPHARPLIIGLLAAIGVSVCYTFSMSSIIPMLKVFFADHETLADWVRRSETERRLGVVIAGDLPNDPRGLHIDAVRPASVNFGELAAGDRIVGIGGIRPSSHALLARIASHADSVLTEVRVQNPDGAERTITLALQPHRPWWDWLAGVLSRLPTGTSPFERLQTLGLVMAVLVGVALVGECCRFVNEGLIAIAVQRAMHDLRTQLAGHVLRLPVHWYNQHPPGDTLSRFAQDIGKVEVGISTLFGKVIREPLKAAGVLTVTLLIDWRLLLMAVVGLPIGVVFIRIFGRLVKRAQRRASQSWGRLLDHLGERLAGVRIVKAYNMEAAESRRFEAEGRELTRAQTHIELVDAATNPALELLAVLAVAIFVMYGAVRVFQQELEPQLFFAAVVCLGAIFDPLRKLGNVNNRLYAADASARRLMELLDIRAEEPAATFGFAHAGAPNGRNGAAPPLPRPDLPRFERDITFDRVSFAYPSNPSRVVLSDISFSVAHGQTVALVGPNGSGKTTLTALLLRFFEPTAGRILIDGRDIAEVSLASLRSQFGLVTQDAVIFSATVRENIAYGDGDIAPAAIEAAARLAHVDEFIRDLRVEVDGQVTCGYDARISGRSLSGGQRQRIAIARAVLRDPPILILDEATSQVDSESERRIQEALEDVTRGRTTFIIAHRFSTIARADRVVVLDAGRIAGIGTHSELLQYCPLYATLCRTQFMHSEA